MTTRVLRVVALFAGLGVASLTGCGEPGATVADHPGKGTYTQYCRSCHQSGIAGAPAWGRDRDWSDRLGKGRAAMVQSVVTGIAPGMPAKGLCSGCSEADLAQAVDYMLTSLAADPAATPQ